MENIEKVEFLFYYCLGVYKWEILGYKYELEGVLLLLKEVLECIKGIIESYGYMVKY